MSIEIELADEETWNRCVERSPGTTPLHRNGALRVMADHSGTEVHRLVGYKGQEPVGLFPVFGLRKAGVAAAFSPPPDLRIPYLGPALLNFEKLKSRKAERRHRRFVDGCVEWLDAELDPRYVHLRTTPGYGDVRPLQWNGFELTPAHTYVVDLDRDREELLGSFSSDARSNVRSGEEYDYAVTVGGPDAIERIIGQVGDRYAAQDVAYEVTPRFVVDLYRALPEGAVRPYVCEVDGEYATGMVVFEGEETAYRWQGGVKTDVDAPVTDLLDWGIMTASRERGVTRYDLVDADTPRLNSYKAKFGPDLAPYHHATRAGRVARTVADLYASLR